MLDRDISTVDCKDIMGLVQRAGISISPFVAETRLFRNSYILSWHIVSQVPWCLWALIITDERDLTSQEEEDFNYRRLYIVEKILKCNHIFKIDST